MSKKKTNQKAKKKQKKHNKTKKDRKKRKKTRKFDCPMNKVYKLCNMLGLFFLPDCSIVPTGL